MGSVLNLSAQVYDDASGSSRENALFVNGRVHRRPGVDFELPPSPSSEPWHVRSRDGRTVDLCFPPAGARGQRLDLALVRSEFVQAFGTWEGHIGVGGVDPLHLRGAFGVAEDHRARWCMVG